MIYRYAEVTCDKCGKKHEFDPKWEDPFSSSFVQEDQGFTKWGKVKGKHFCDDCYKAYIELSAEAIRSVDERFGL